MGALNQPTFSGVQANLVQPTINEEYQALTKETIKRLAGKEITVAGMIYLPWWPSWLDRGINVDAQGCITLVVQCPTGHN